MVYGLLIRMWSLRTTDSHVVDFILNSPLVLYATPDPVGKPQPVTHRANTNSTQPAVTNGSHRAVTNGPLAGQAVTEKMVDRVGKAQPLMHRANPNSTQPAADNGQSVTEVVGFRAGTCKDGQDEKDGCAFSVEIGPCALPTVRELTNHQLEIRAFARKAAFGASYAWMETCPFVSWSNLFRTLWLRLKKVMGFSASAVKAKAEFEFGCISVFRLNGIDIIDPAERLSICCLVFAAVLHPRVHAFFDRMYIGRASKSPSHGEPLGQNADRYDELFWHGQYLNYNAWWLPGQLWGDARWLKTCLCFNSKGPIPPHHHFIPKASNSVGIPSLLPYSQYLDFLVRARTVIVATAGRYQLPIKNPEWLFLSTAVHSLDHYCAAMRLLWHKLPDTSQSRSKLLRSIRAANSNSKAKKSKSKSILGLLTKSYPNLFTPLFIAPAQSLATNLLPDKRRNTPFYDELYKELAKINHELSQVITLSISY